MGMPVCSTAMRFADALLPRRTDHRRRACRDLACHQPLRAGSTPLPTGVAEAHFIKTFFLREKPPRESREAHGCAVIHIKLEDLPGCADLTRSVGGHIECKVSNNLILGKIIKQKITWPTMQ